MSDALSTTLASAGVEDWLVDAVNRIARSEGRSLDGLLVTVGESLVLDQTKATCRCRFVVKDTQGRPRVSALVDMLAYQVVDYCIPRSRIDEAKKDLQRSGSTEKFLQLQREARELFTTLEKSGEGGELLLYILLEVVLGIPQILCKMSLKTNSQMHVHGADGVHARALANGNLAIYWGESKLYGDVNKAIDACMESLAPYLLDEGGGASSRDLLLLRDNLDTGDQELTAALVRFFKSHTIEAANLEIRGACLVGFSVENYPDPYGEDGVSVPAEVVTAVDRWRDRIIKRVSHHKIETFELEVFCVPLPSVADFREQLRMKLGAT